MCKDDDLYIIFEYGRDVLLHWVKLCDCWEHVASDDIVSLPLRSIEHIHQFLTVSNAVYRHRTPQKLLYLTHHCLLCLHENYLPLLRRQLRKDLFFWPSNHHCFLQHVVQLSQIFSPLELPLKTPRVLPPLAIPLSEMLKTLEDVRPQYCEQIEKLSRLCQGRSACE